MHTTEGGSKTYLDDLFIHNRRSDGEGKYPTVSVHFCIYADGEIHSYAPWRKGKAYYTYHAGQSWMPDGRASASRYLIGIELQHKAGQAYPQVQIGALVWLLREIQREYAGEPDWNDTLTEHRVVAPKRKSDPTTPWDAVKGPIYAAWNECEEEVDDMTDKDRELYRRPTAC